MFLLACLTTTPPSHAMAGMDRWSQYPTACMVPWTIHGPHCTYIHTCMNAKLQSLLYGDLVWGQFVTRCPQPCLFLCVCSFQTSELRLAWGYHHALRLPHHIAHPISTVFGYVSLLSLVSWMIWSEILVWWWRWRGVVAMQCNRVAPKGCRPDRTVSFAGLPVYIRLVFIRNRRRLFWFPFCFVHESMDYLLHILATIHGAIHSVASFLSSLWKDIRVITF